MSSAVPPASSGHWTPYFVSSDSRETRAIVGQDIVSHTLEHKSRRTRPVTVRYRTASVGTLGFHEMAYSMFGAGEATIHVPDMENIYLCEVNLAGEMAVGQSTASTPFRPGQIYMINAHAPHSKVWRTDGRQLMIRIHQTDMEAALERLLGMPVRDPVLFDRVPQPIAGTAETLCNMIALMGSDLELDGSFFAGPEGAAAKQTILDLMLKALPNNYSDRLADSTPRLRPRHVRHAAAYIHSHWADPVRLDALVRASGVSMRSLHAGFRKYYGVSPMTYLRNVRLDQARLRLKREGSGDVTVTEVALECGFTHLGKFAGAYRERFGELPSETLLNA